MTEVQEHLKAIAFDRLLRADTHVLDFFFLGSVADAVDILKSDLCLRLRFCAQILNS